MRLKKCKGPLLVLAAAVLLTLTACSGQTPSSAFPNIPEKDLPDILEKTVGRTGDVYFTSFDRTQDKEYRSYLAVTFQDTTEADRSELMEHYQAESIGTGEDGSLLFDWGWLTVSPEEQSIFVEAYIK